MDRKAEICLEAAANLRQCEPLDSESAIFVATVLEQLIAARPTADLGEDGELIRLLGALANDARNTDGWEDAAKDIDQARDRLILYREALAKADKCAGCDRPRSSYCATCERDWQS